MFNFAVMWGQEVGKRRVYVKLVKDKDNNPCIQLFETKESKDAFQELPLQPAYSLSEISHQIFDQYSKIFTLKLQYIFYKETAGIRPGQITKMQKLTEKIGFLAKFQLKIHPETKMVWRLTHSYDLRFHKLRNGCGCH